MPYFLSPYIGVGTKADPFRPTGADRPGWSAIDLRADKGATVDGGGFRYALLWLPPGTTEAPALVKIGDNKIEKATNQVKNFIENKTGLDFSGDVSLQDVLETLLVSPPIGWWNAIKPAAGRMEAWLGGERLIDFPVLAGGSLSDDFNRADETPIAAPWTRLPGSNGGLVNLASNAIAKSSSGDTFYYYSYGPGWNADHSSQLQYVSTVTNHEWGPAVRIGVSGFSGYFIALDIPAMCKFVSGSFTNIENAAMTVATGTYYTVSVAGSTLTYSKTGTPDANSPATDTSLTTAGNGPGLALFQSGGSLDDWVATGEIGGARGLLSRGNPMAHLVVR